jgi:hypothetical protein
VFELLTSSKMTTSRASKANEFKTAVSLKQDDSESKKMKLGRHNSSIIV